MTIKNLKCEYRSDPVGICVRKPRFSWQLFSEESGTSQTAYRLCVAESEEEMSRGIYVYDSGKIEGDQCFGVRYAGEPLELFRKYFWTVSIWCGADEALTSDVQSFETGLFSLSDWNAKWITAKGANGPIHIRCSFPIPTDKQIVRARLYSATTTGAFGNLTFCVNDVYPTLNGAPLGNDVLLPGQISEKRWRALYRVYDVTDKLLSGENAFGAVVLSMAYSAFLRVELDDATVLQLPLTDSCRMNGKGPYTLWDEGVEDQAGKREDHNSLLEYSGYDMPGYDDSEWTEPRFTDCVTELWEQTVTAERIEALKPVKITQLGWTHYVLDFGKVINGHIKLVMRDTAYGRRVSVSYAEDLYPNGEIDATSTINFPRGENGPHTDTYVTKGAAEEIFEPRFANHSFRYALLTNVPTSAWADGYPQTVCDAVAIVVHSPVRNESFFECSDADINALYSISYRSQIDNLVTVPTDCPSRERHGWLGDALVVSESECINFDLLTFYESWMRSIEDDQYDNGNLQYITPFQSDIIRGHVDIPWCTAAVAIPYFSYHAYGDPTVLEESYPMMTRWVDFMTSLCDSEGMLHGGAYWGDHTAKEPMDKEWVGNLYYYLNLKLMIKISDMIGKDSGEYSRLAQRTEKLLKRKLAEADGFDGGRQGDLAHALSLGLADGQYAEHLLSLLVDNIEENRYRITCGCLGIWHLIRALEIYGRHDIIYKICKQDQKGGFLWWIKECNATTAFEYLYTKDWVSHNHPFLMGSITRWFFEGLAGIRKLSAGYKRVEIRPYFPNGMEWIRADVDTPYGRISLRADKGAGYYVSLPCGVRAVLYTCEGKRLELESGEHRIDN